METNSDLHLFGHVSGMAAEAEEPHRVVPVPSPHPSSLLEAGSSSLLELTPEKPPPVRGRRSRTGRPVRLKQHDFSDVRTPTDSEAPDVVVVTPELGVPGLHSSAPLYHRLQQYRVSSGEIASLERKTRGERETGGERVCVREAEEMEEDPLPPLPHSTTSPAPPSLDSEPAENGAQRYSDLVAVDVSEESFQRLTTRSRKTRSLGRAGGRGRRDSPSTAGPNIMEFFSPEFEVEEIAVPALPAAPHPQLFEPSIDDALTLYHYVYRFSSHTCACARRL